MTRKKIVLPDDCAIIVRPDDCAIEDIQYHLYVIEKIRKGISRANEEGAMSQQDVEKRLSKWSTK